MIKSGSLKGRIDWKIQSVHKIPTLTVLSLPINAEKKNLTLQIHSLKHTVAHIHTDEHTNTHSSSLL